jgi:hypothetical protein
MDDHRNGYLWRYILTREGEKMKRRIEIKVINRYGKTINTCIYNSKKDAERAAERLKEKYFDDVTILTFDKTNYKK